MRLHQRGVHLLVNVMDAADHAEQLTPDETKRLLKEVVEVMSLILERDAHIALQGERLFGTTGEPGYSISKPVLNRV